MAAAAAVVVVLPSGVPIILCIMNLCFWPDIPCGTDPSMQSSFTNVFMFMATG